MPIIEKEVESTITEIVYDGFQCDDCGSMYNKDDHLEISSALHYKRMNGFTPEWSITLCQKCIQDRLGDCIVIENQNM